MNACRSCGAWIKWVSTVSGVAMPLDPNPCTDGNLGLDDVGVVRVIPEKERAAYTRPRYKSHFASCPYADDHKRFPR